MIAFTEEYLNDLVIIAISGRLDTSGGPKIEACCYRALEKEYRHFLLDLGAMDYISSAGLRSLTLISKAVAAVHGKLILCQPNAMARDIFSISGFDQIFTITDNQDDALELFERL
jgi:anti-anti-sigma factor